MDDKKDFCEMIDSGLNRSMTFSLTAAALAAVLSSILILYISLNFDHVYTLFNSNTDKGQYHIMPSDEVYSCAKCSVKVTDVFADENGISARLSITAKKNADFSLGLSDFDMYLSDNNAKNEPIRCELEDIDCINVSSGETVSVIISASSLPENYSEMYTISAIYRIPNSQERVEFLLN